MELLSTAIEKLSVTNSYRGYTYGILSSRGISCVFNYMRYYKAFLVRDLDIDYLISLIGDEAALALKPFTVVLCRYCWSTNGAYWSPSHLLSTQSILDVPVKELPSLNLKRTPLVIKPPANYLAVHKVTGLPAEVLRAMYDNHAMPLYGADANALEFAMAEGDKPITINLIQFSNKMNIELKI